jgi:DAK2 domain fusion protein YloV
MERFAVDGLRATVRVFREAMRAHRSVIDALNVYPVPDGDTGTNMARTLDAVVEEMDAAPGDLGPTCAAIAHGALMGARGNSGVILSQILRGLVGALADADADARRPGASAAALAASLVAGANGAYKAVARPIEGTILTVAREAADAAAALAKSGASIDRVVRAARDAGRDALARTPELLPVLKAAGVVDAGGAGFLLFLDALAHVTAGDPMPEPEYAVPAEPDRAGDGAEPHAGPPGVADLRYEVMFFMDLADERIDAFKGGWTEIGDSIVVVGGDGVWNCHVHTNDIGAAIEVPLELGGRPSKIRVTDLYEEVEAEHARREAALAGEVAAASVRRHLAAAGLPPVTTAVVAVCSGDGLAELFWQLGVQGVVTGGQTMNPSTAELLEAVEHVNAGHVVVLPNNKNIIPVAEQIDALSPKTVRVVPTRSMPEALAALVVYDPEATADENAAEMADAASSVLTGEVTRAVRATHSPAGDVSEGDWIGLVRGEGIVSVAQTVDAAAIGLLDTLVTDRHELVTVIEGGDAPAETTEALRAWLGAARPGAQVEVHRGGQPLYPYLFGVE